MEINNPYMNRPKIYGKSVKRISISLSEETYKKLEQELEVLNSEHNFWNRSNLIEAYINEKISRRKK